MTDSELKVFLESEEFKFYLKMREDAYRDIIMFEMNDSKSFDIDRIKSLYGYKYIDEEINNKINIR